MKKPWFEVDKQGLASLSRRRKLSFVLTELLQNAWDEKSTMVDISIQQERRGLYVIRIEDDNPDGFADLTHAFTLFASTSKRRDPEKRGRFNIGEKLVLSLAKQAEIISTKGAYWFDEKGRRRIKAKKDSGSTITVWIPMSRWDVQNWEEEVLPFLVPPCKTFYNEEFIPYKNPIASFETTLPTEYEAPETGQMRRTQRKTKVEIYDFAGRILEMGIPVCESEMLWTVNVLQKIPMAIERDSIPESYLTKLRTAVLDHMHDQLPDEQASEAWVTSSIETCSPRTVGAIVKKRWGEKVVTYDPTDAEANNRAASEGYVILYGGQFSKAQWEKVKSSGVARPAGQVTPSPKCYSEGGRPEKIIDVKDYTPAMKRVATFMAHVGTGMIDIEPSPVVQTIGVKIVNEPTVWWRANYGNRILTLNYGKLGRKWFESKAIIAKVELLIHEMAHDVESNHLSAKYHQALAFFGARAVHGALKCPELFKL